MQTKRLGKSAISVSTICMGTMTFGSQADEKTAFRILDKSLDAGINFSTPPKTIPCRRRKSGQASPKRFLAAG